MHSIHVARAVFFLRKKKLQKVHDIDKTYDNLCRGVPKSLPATYYKQTNTDKSSFHVKVKEKEKVFTIELHGYRFCKLYVDLFSISKLFVLVSIIAYF